MDMYDDYLLDSFLAAYITGQYSTKNPLRELHRHTMQRTMLFDERETIYTDDIPIRECGF